MTHIRAAQLAIKHALLERCDASMVADLVALKEDIARLETKIAAQSDVGTLCKEGMTRRAARRAVRRADNPWFEQVGVEHQDEILGGLEQLSDRSDQREAIYRAAAEAAPHSSLHQIRNFTNKLVREENSRLSHNPDIAFSLRKF
ncbi:hypothetical protein [Corynebacterium epidermidicanis]|uniref:Uncharacterized protein n=1 Tax=Corynebacterium epidermidicanis TaxID=1050174 RepID=A0A0G3GL95_9CORY|nr:hypothetical protein [Corynebacterium epidermidicanis]AKK01929.1 hypothetical protein CEPID_00165 [Corynebacterium epidermidicanis]